MLYQIQDLADSTAVVEVIRNLFFGPLVEWKIKTPGAFRPDLKLNHTCPAKRVRNDVYCNASRLSGETICIFVMFNFFTGNVCFAQDEGKGMLFASGVGQGNLQATSMTWKKL